MKPKRDLKAERDLSQKDEDDCSRQVWHKQMNGRRLAFLELLLRSQKKRKQLPWDWSWNWDYEENLENYSYHCHCYLVKMLWLLSDDSRRELIFRKTLHRCMVVWGPLCFLNDIMPGCNAVLLRWDYAIFTKIIPLGAIYYWSCH